MKKTAFSTPMMQQYMSIKSEYPDALLFFRLGDFYELFMQDAEIGAEVLDITLTARPRGKDGKIPMAGVPYHAVDNYLSKLVKAGYKVAICEQVSEPDGKGIVEREVVRVITPGTILDEKALQRKTNNYLISLLTDGSYLAIAACDISTGYFQVKQTETDELLLDIIEEINKLQPAECILPSLHYEDPDILKALKHDRSINIFEYKKWDSFADSAADYLQEHFNVKTLSHFNIHSKTLAQKASAALLGYLKETQKSALSHIKKISYADNENSVVIDSSTITNLEIFSTIRDRESKGALISVIDRTKTAMGGRLLKQWLISPLKSKEEINKRLELVDELSKNSDLSNKLASILKNINDVERILARIASGLANPRDIISLKESLKQVLDIKTIVKQCESDLALEYERNISKKIQTIVDLIEKSILDEPSIHLKDGGIVKIGFDKKLDSLKSSISSDQEWILNLEKKEKSKLSLSSLKVGFNKVFGYYIEISKGQAKNAPKSYIRKQTLVNAERFITPELKKREEKILSAEEKIKAREYEIFMDVVEKILRQTDTIQSASVQIAQVDVLLNFAEIAQSYDYTKPNLLYSNELHIKAGRHPVVEQILPTGKFVPNDVIIKPAKQNLLLITGPNMAGKSVLMRQVALIVLLAQIGCFVPASSARIGIVDRIFVRSGASDVITSGLSTFMMEMVETSYILNHATKKSLIIMDEIGRGTSTYDGISIAWAVAEYLTKLSPKTLFATHYHELQKLEKEIPSKIANWRMAIEKRKEGPVFLYQFERGGAPHSFGVEVAKMAGIPKTVINNASKLLDKFENKNDELNNETKLENKALEKIVKKIDVNNTTPIEALKLIDKIKKVYERNL